VDAPTVASTPATNRFGLAVADPPQLARTITVDGEALVVATRSRAQGNAWLALWLPQLLAGREERIVRCVMASHLGSLQAIIVVERGPEQEPFSRLEDDTLVELARQVAWALHDATLEG